MTEHEVPERDAPTEALDAAESLDTNAPAMEETDEVESLPEVVEPRAPSALASREDLLKAMQIKETRHYIKTIGKDIVVREMSGAQRDKVTTYFTALSAVNSTADADDDEAAAAIEECTTHHTFAFIIAQCLIDDAGNRIFSDDDVDTILGLGSSAVEDIYAKCDALCLHSDLAIEEVAKN